ncbi:hypothetical protein SAMN05216184_10739 [Georgenia satyanarayanai]|uniref:Uncharacterized protein n=1 Tax=Georgenia satyanarayanai TaxID=860221 RepID=A0A2Y9AF44_9MICO|nr:hypothetical protein [Georgenia satyanarayanai]PYF99329.1 hypothetical protein A8987_10739 [Georgenia satyanarayanai]SSA43141.1 hypothetical protein SAMN05216184_10739 [Georgenia satyanarayanai]
MENEPLGPLPDVARALLEALLAHDLPAAPALRAQAVSVRTRPGCTCGCGTLELVVTDDGAPLAPLHGTFPVEGEVHDDDGTPVAGLLLFVEEGRLSSLEIFSYGDDGLPLPAPDRVTWVERPPVA